MKFQRTESELVFEPGFLQVYKDTVSSSDDTFTRYRVHHPGAVVVVPVRKGKAVLVEQYRSALDAQVLEAVAGKFDVPGEPPTETAQRELAEEVGLRAGRFVKLCDFFNSPGFTDQHNHVYLALDLEEVPRTPHGPEEEAMQTVEIELDSIEELIVTGRLVCASAIVGLLLARSYLAGEFAGIS